VTYDSRADTYEHIDKVRTYMNRAICNLLQRAAVHDRSKLSGIEKEAFDAVTPRLAETEYGSDEYRATLREIKPAIQEHYKWNTHHPEHYRNGVADMTLLDLIEMLCDWKAASERVKDGNLKGSMDYNQERFGYSDELASILDRTLFDLGLY